MLCCSEVPPRTCATRNLKHHARLSAWLLAASNPPHPRVSSPIHDPRAHGREDRELCNVACSRPPVYIRAHRLISVSIANIHYSSPSPPEKLSAGSSCLRRLDGTVLVSRGYTRSRTAIRRRRASAPSPSPSTTRSYQAPKQHQP